jgi:UDP-glucose:(heptosyl)LPS alpha-1,3-glucosyltransferase
MKIAYAMINVNRRDGSARAVIEVAERLARKHEVHLFARTVEDADLSNMTWHKMPGPGWPEVADFASYRWQTRRKLKLSDFDIIHSIGCNAWEANVVTIQNIQPVKRRILDRLSREEKVSLPRRMTRWLYLNRTSAAEKFLYAQNSQARKMLFLPVSQGVRRELEDTYNLNGAKVEIIPNAADLSIFKPLTAEKSTIWREENRIAESDILAIFVGGEWARKGLDLAIRGVAKSSIPNLKLYVAGTDPDEARFRLIAEKSGAAERIVFGGFRKDVAAAMAASDLFLFPSWYEAFSLASIEAAACGLPIIATRINGTEDFIQPGITGEFIDHEPENVAETLNEIASDPAKLKEMGKAARKLVENNYTWDRVAAMTEKAYQNMLNT